MDGGAAFDMERTGSTVNSPHAVSSIHPFPQLSDGQCSIEGLLLRRERHSSVAIIILLLPVRNFTSPPPRRRKQWPVTQPQARNPPPPAATEGQHSHTVGHGIGQTQRKPRECHRRAPVHVCQRTRPPQEPRHRTATARRGYNATLATCRLATPRQDGRQGEQDRRRRKVAKPEQTDQSQAD
jgi:hypothetical protein